MGNGMSIVTSRRSESPAVPLLQVSGVGFSVAGRTILDGLELELREREIHALLGSNGTGKTTLAYLIMGCAGYAPDRGEIRFQGRVINGLPIHERARLGITMAWQEPARFEGLSVWSYLALMHPYEDPAAYLAQVGLEPAAYLNRPLDKTLSGGERKRIELASVLALHPRLAILDEPASGIDMLSLDEIAAVIRGLKQQGASVLLITHREEMTSIADRASYLCGGRIIFSGPPDAVAKRYKERRCVVCDGRVCHEQVE
jgi:Fe-S cluster assembly ATP-binding protein